MDVRRYLTVVAVGLVLAGLVVAAWVWWPDGGGDPGCAAWARHNDEVSAVSARIQAGEVEPWTAEELAAWTREAAAEVDGLAEDRDVGDAARRLIVAIDAGDAWLAEWGELDGLNLACARL